MAKQPAKAAFGWMDPLGTLFGRHLRKGREKEKGNKNFLSLPAGGLGASSASLVPFMGSLADVI